MEHPNTTPIEIPKKGETEALAEKYFRAFFLPGLIATVFAVSAQFLENTFWICLVAYAGLLTYVAWKLYEEKASPSTAFWTMFTAMLIVVFAVAVVKLAVHFKFIYFLNLVTEPLIYAIIGGALAYLVISALERAKKSRSNNKIK